MQKEIKLAISNSIDVKTQILSDEFLLLQIENAVKILEEAFRQKCRVFFCGNGGSAADAQHLAAELSGRFYFDRPPLDAEALHCNTSYVTAVGNDYGYEHIFSRLVKAMCKKGDVLVAISTSGNSVNIVNAVKEAKMIGAQTIALTGAKESELSCLCDITIKVPSTDTPRIQEAHITIGHIICQIVEKRLFD